MENASKALIIAGSILIAIILIGLGIVVINIVNKPIDESHAQVDSLSAQQFNSTFTGYAGTQKAQAVKDLMTAVASSAGNRTIGVTKNTAASTVTEVQSTVKTGQNYVVSFTFDGDGYISSVDVSGTFN